MALGIKQKLLAYHIGKRDSFGKQIELAEKDEDAKIENIRDGVKESYEFHAAAVEFLSA